MKAPTKALPDVAELRRLFAYCQETGVLTWLSNPKFMGRAVGKVGTIGETGYLMIGISRRYYGAHRIIWKMVTGDDPPAFVDHINGNKLDNRWSNLRAADNRCNLWNSKLRRDNKSGFKGVQLSAEYRRKPWRAVLALGRGKYQTLGYFHTPEEAAEAWRVAAEKQRGEFFRAA